VSPVPLSKVAFGAFCCLFAVFTLSFSVRYHGRPATPKIWAQGNFVRIDLGNGREVGVFTLLESYIAGFEVLCEEKHY